MLGIIKKIKLKQKDISGETLVETLVALLVACIAVIMLATMISSSVNLVLNSREKTEIYVSQLNQMIAGSGEDVTSASGTVTVMDNGSAVSLGGNDQTSIVLKAVPGIGPVRIVSWEAQP